MAAYPNSFGGPFVFDDHGVDPENPTIRHLWPIGKVLSPPSNGETVSGRPLLNLSFAINYALGGTEVWGYHAANLAIHIAGGLAAVRHRAADAAAARPAGAMGDGGHAAGPGDRPALGRPSAANRVGHLHRAAGRVAGGLFYLLTLYCVIRGDSCGKPGCTVGLGQLVLPGKAHGWQPVGPCSGTLRPCWPACWAWPPRR